MTASQAVEVVFEVIWALLLGVFKDCVFQGRDIEASSLQLVEVLQLLALSRAQLVTLWIAASSEAASGQGLVELWRPDDLLKHPIGFFFADQVLLMSLHIACFGQLDDRIWVRGLPKEGHIG